MSRLGRRQPFKPVLSRLIAYSPAPPIGTQTVVSKVAVSQSAEQHARLRGHVTLPRLIQYAPSIPPPIKPVIVSALIANERHAAHRVFGPKLTGLMKYQAPASQPPIGKNRILSFAAIDTAVIRYHRLYHPFFENPILQTGSLTTPFLPLIRRDPKAPPVLRGFTERVTNILNALMRSGQLVQTGPDDWEIRPKQ